MSAARQRAQSKAAAFAVTAQHQAALADANAARKAAERAAMDEQVAAFQASAAAAAVAKREKARSVGEQNLQVSVKCACVCVCARVCVCVCVRVRVRVRVCVRGALFWLGGCKV